MIIYKIISEKTSSVYVGMTGVPLKRRFGWHEWFAKNHPKSPLHAAMRKHGPDKFRIVAVDTAKNRRDANALEKHWIKRLRAHVSEGGFNVSAGGFGTNGLTGAWKERHRLRTKEAMQRLEVREKVSGQNMFRKHTQTKKFKALMREHMLGKKKSPEHVAKMRAWRRSPEGVAAAKRAAAAAHTPEQLKKLGKRMKNLWKNPEYRAKQSASRKAAWVARRKKLQSQE